MNISKINILIKGIWVFAIPWHSSYVIPLFNSHTSYTFHIQTSPLKPLCKITVMGPEWIHLKIMSHSPTLHSRWPPLLKIEMSLIDHYFFILHQNELKFKMLLHDSSFKFVSNNISINPRWPLLPKIEISLIDHYCFVLC